MSRERRMLRLGFMVVIVSSLAPERLHSQAGETHFSLKDGGIDERVFRTGPESEKCVRFGPEGVRVRLPKGHAGERTATGVATTIPIKGDFDIAVDFDILDEPTPQNAGERASKVSLVLTLDTDGKGRLVGLSRRVAANTGIEFTAWGPGFKAFPATARNGTLRITRNEGELAYFVREGNAAEFRLLKRQPFIVADVLHLKVAASTGGPDATLDVRFADLRIRSQADGPVAVAAVATPPRPTRWTPWMLVLALLLLMGGAWIAHARRGKPRRAGP